ncbi:MAG TPA: hypothetical protein VJW20_20205 [Candidatus Angelobacter sp.]|nr:hypothetical protein [Candidatus Angelobacter sp.]
MSEQNILNPTAASQMNPTYTIPHKDPTTISSWQPRSGKPFSHYMMARGMEFDLHWDEVQFSTYLALRQWFRQYERDFFSYFDIDDNRYYTGQFRAEPQYERAGNNQVNVTATFVVIPTLPQFQYPSNWGVDSIFIEERDGFGSDLVKLTGTWDHDDKNYCLWSEQFDNAAWVKTNAVVTANAVADPNGNVDADSVAFSVTGSSSIVGQIINPSILIAGQAFTFSVWLKSASGAPHLTLVLEDQANNALQQTTFALTTAWQRFSVSGTALATATSLKIFLFNPDSTSIAYHLWGAQLEYGAAATTYVTTTASPVVLPAPNANLNFHGGFGYVDPGTVTTDAAEWLYFGYGFRLWFPRGPDMGIVGCLLDGAFPPNNSFDLYSASAQPSSALITNLNVPLGEHRIKVFPTGQKNAASTNFYVVADALEVMR